MKHDLLEVAALYLHAAYDRPPQTPEAIKMLADIDAAPEAAKLEAQPVGIPAGIREFLEHWIHDSHLQTFEDRQRFRAAAADLLSAAPALPVELVQGMDAMHASAPTGHGCADCAIDGEACPACYQSWWSGRHPNVIQTAAPTVGLPVVSQEPMTEAHIESCYNLALNQSLRPQDKAMVFKFARAIEAAFVGSKK